MNMQIAATISPVMMFLRASLRFIRERAFYRRTSATIAPNSSAR